MSGPRTVAFVLPSYTGGGAERVTLNLLKLADRRRLAPILIVLDPNGPLAGDVPEDVPVHALRIPRISRAMPALVGLLRRLRPEVVFSTFTHVNLPLLAARPFLKGSRIVAREANLPSLSLARMPRPEAFRRGCRWLYPKADLMIATSERMRAEFEEMGVPSSKIGILHNPVDEARLRARAEPVERKPGPGIRFAAMGRLVRQKGFDRVLDTMAALPADGHCAVLGEGPELPALEARIGELGLEEQVTLAGFVANPAPIVAGADAFLMPSRFEGMPNAALEALALGTPVIATPEAGGIAEVDGVTIAEAGQSFVEAARAVRPHACARLRSSALPAPFRMEAVAERLSDLLERLSVR